MKRAVRPAQSVISAAEFRVLAGATRSGPGGRYRALGRMAPDRMNKTEAAFASVLEARRAAGEVLWWAFQAIKLRLADRTWFTPDFAVLPADRVMQLVDVKGAAHLIEEDAKVKVKACAEIFPLRFFYAWPRKGSSCFELVEVGA